MKVRRAEIARVRAYVITEITHTYTRYAQPQWSDGGESITAEEEGPKLIVFLRINIINVIQQSVLDEGATTPSVRKNPQHFSNRSCHRSGA